MEFLGNVGERGSGEQRLPGSRAGWGELGKAGSGALTRKQKQVQP
jgi:hypothetical protein